MSRGGLKQQEWIIKGIFDGNLGMCQNMSKPLFFLWFPTFGEWTSVNASYIYFSPSEGTWGLILVAILVAVAMWQPFEWLKFFDFAKSFAVDREGWADRCSPKARPPSRRGAPRRSMDLCPFVASVWSCQRWIYNEEIHLGLSENSVPLNPMVNDHYPY